MIIRPLDNKDFPQIKDIVYSHDKMYGVDITKYHNTIIGSFRLSNTENTIVAEDNKLLYAVIKQTFWCGLPAWSFGSMFFRSKYNTEIVIDIGCLFFKYLTNLAENRKIYDFYYIVRDIGTRRRDMSFSASDTYSRYDYIDVEIIKPFTKSKYSSFNNLLGYTCGLNTKELVIRHGHLKEEFRSD